MTVRTVVHRKFVLHVAVAALAIAVLRTSAAQSFIVGGLIEFANMSERILRIPCQLSDHMRCFSLDNLDPTCPQCL